MKRLRSGQAIKRQERQSTEKQKLPPLDAGIHFRDPKDRSKTAGWQWALQHGFTHIDRLSEKDAVTILDHLGFTPYDVEYSDGYEEMLHLRYPWKWLESYQKKHGDTNKLIVRSKS